MCCFFSFLHTQQCLIGVILRFVMVAQHTPDLDQGMLRVFACVGLTCR